MNQRITRNTINLKTKHCYGTAVDWRTLLVFYHKYMTILFPFLWPIFFNPASNTQGLRIAPPEAPVTGYMFGKGLYFADLVSKSANYCHANKDSPIALMLLAEVALGEMYELKKAKYMDKPPKGLCSI